MSHIGIKDHLPGYQVYDPHAVETGRQCKIAYSKYLLVEREFTCIAQIDITTVSFFKYIERKQITAAPITTTATVT